MVRWIEEIPGVNCQEASHDELKIESLKVTLQEALALTRYSSTVRQINDNVIRRMKILKKSHVDKESLLSLWSLLRLRKWKIIVMAW